MTKGITNNILPSVTLDGTTREYIRYPKGDSLWGGVRIGDVYYASLYGGSKIYKMKIPTMELVGTLNFPSGYTLQGHGQLGTDNQGRLYGKFMANSTGSIVNDMYDIIEINKDTGNLMGIVINPTSNFHHNSNASFYINWDWDLLFVPTYSGTIYTYQASTGTYLGYKSIGSYVVSVFYDEETSDLIFGTYNEKNMYALHINDYDKFNYDIFLQTPTRIYVTDKDADSTNYIIFDDFLLYGFYSDRVWKMTKIPNKEERKFKYVFNKGDKWYTYNLNKLFKGVDSLIPIMLNTNTPSGVVDVSSIYDNINYQGFRAFDGSQLTDWVSASNKKSGWISYTFDSPTIVNAYEIQCRELNIGETPKDWTLSAWNGSSWIVLDRQTQSNWIPYESRVFKFENDIAYSKYKLEIHSNNGYSFFAIKNIKMYYTDTNWYEIPLASGQTMPKLKDIHDYALYNTLKVPDKAWEELHGDGTETVDLYRMCKDWYSDYLNIYPNLISTEMTNTKYVTTTFTPMNQVAIPIDNLPISSDVFSYSLNINKKYEDKIRLFVSFNNGVTWESFRNSKWSTLDMSSESNISKYGMRVWEFENIRTKDFASKIDYGFVKVGFMIETEDVDRTMEDIEEITSRIFTYMNGAELNELSLYILNTTSTINISFVGNKLSATLNDFDNGLVRYRVFLNDQPFYPITGEYSTFDYASYDVDLILQSKDINMGVNNKLVFEFVDYWGNSDAWTVNFIGTYAGLMFQDPSNGSYYTSDIGDILKNLNLGTWTAGQTSTEHKVKLINKYGYQVQDLEVRAINEVMPNGIKIELSKTQYPFVTEEVLTWNQILNYDQAVDFWLRMGTKVTSNSITNGKFEVRANAKRV